MLPRHAARFIDPLSRMPTPDAGDPNPCNVAAIDSDTRLALAPLDEEKGIHTTHFSVVDKWGNMVSYTTTIESTWGTGIMVPGYGFLLNNELTDFNFTPQYDAATGNPAPTTWRRSSVRALRCHRRCCSERKAGGGLRFAWRFDDHQFGVQHDDSTSSTTA